MNLDYVNFEFRLAWQLLCHMSPAQTLDGFRQLDCNSAMRIPSLPDPNLRAPVTSSILRPRQIPTSLWHWGGTQHGPLGRSSPTDESAQNPASKETEILK